MAPLAAAAALLIAVQAAMAQEERPLALVLSATKGSILRSATLSPLSATPGSILFAGDALLSPNDGSVTFVSCLNGLQQTLSAGGDVLFEARDLRVRTGKLTDSKPATGCFLPSLPRDIVASQQDAGATVAREMSRDIPTQSLPQRLQQLPEDRRNQLIAAVAPIDAALRNNPADPIFHLARAELLTQYGLALDAADEMKQVIDAWPDAGWARSRRFTLEKNGARGVQVNPPKPLEAGTTYALLIGISQFQNPGVQALQFAHADANELTRLLESQRAGGVLPANIVSLVNEHATRGAIQGAIETHLLARAGKGDTVILFIASHGAAFENKGYIVAYDSDPKDLATTGIPMDDIKKLFVERLSGVSRLLLYVDVCHAGKIGEIEPKADMVNKSAEGSLTHPAMFGMLAAQSKQVAIEGPEFGGGHGAFSYFLMSGLNGDADTEHTGKVTMGDLSIFVQSEVYAATSHKQSPKQIGEVDETVLSLVDKPGIALGPYQGRVLSAARGRDLTSPQPSVLSSDSTPATGPDQRTPELVKQFEDAVSEGRILMSDDMSDDRSAFALLAPLRNTLDPAGYLKESDKLRVALEDKGQQVLIHYLAGEAVPQDRDDFLRGERYFQAAESLTPDSVYLQSRIFFCQGRVSIFDRNYDRAITLLERAVGLDPQRAYAYNALGIAYLERAQYERAVLAFRDAANRAPYWAYPLHNMALAFVERGDYENAIRTYRRAMQLAPGAVYLSYNLGLVYQRTNRPKDAAKLYAQALKLDPNNARVLNAMGSLRAGAGKPAEAETLYRHALAIDPNLLSARYNLGTLLSTDSKRGAEAVALWRDNLTRDSKDLPSRLALAGFLAKQGNHSEAAQEYELVLAQRPDYVAARLALADSYTKTGHPAEALAQLQSVLVSQPDNPEILERTAQVYLALGRNADARAAYERALPFVSSRSARNRIRAALKKLP
jgi:tetratricopeptide (TPR) repeat protein